uniref:Uncharacterized protein n=1 Tax=Pseudo-nitzschia australis TaxID=44445 RepID=A0A6V0AHL4_9STRA
MMALLLKSFSPGPAQRLSLMRHLISASTASAVCVCVCSPFLLVLLVVSIVASSCIPPIVSTFTSASASISSSVSSLTCWYPDQSLRRFATVAALIGGVLPSKTTSRWALVPSFRSCNRLTT